MSQESRVFAMMRVDKTSQLIDQVDQLYKQALNAFFATIAVLVYVVYKVYGEVPDARLWPWVAAIVAINLYLVIWILHVRKRGINGANVRAHLYGYQFEALLHGGAWGALPFLLAHSTHPEQQLFAYFVICGMAAGAIATTAMLYRVYLTFMLPMMLPIILWQFIGAGVQVFDSGVQGLLVIFVAAMLLLARAHYDSVIKSIRLVQQNDVLVDDLRSAVDRSEAANQAKTEFLSNTSHELRTPLNAIMGFSNLLMKFADEDLPNKAREYVRNIHQAGSHLSELINQVLDIAKIETSKAPTKKEPINIAKMLAETITLMRPLAVQHQVGLKELTDDCRDDEVHVLADPLRLRQVIINLISNAIKYNREQGEVHIHCWHRDGKVTLEVADTGIGIAEEQQQEIFAPFTRANHDMNVEGTGIGLTVTKKNLELMGSAIKLESVPGEGSRFWFELPMTDEREEVKVVRGQSPVPESGLDIQMLYVEDNPLGMRLMQEVMAQVEGITLFCAETGEEGYRLAMQIQPDVILLDINLPDISGMEVMRRLRDTPSMRHVPMVALSASALDEDVERGLRAGFTDYLKKPCLPDEIVQRVIELASKRDRGAKRGVTVMR